MSATDVKPGDAVQLVGPPGGPYAVYVRFPRGEESVYVGETWSSSVRGDLQSVITAWAELGRAAEPTDGAHAAGCPLPSGHDDDCAGLIAAYSATDRDVREAAELAEYQAAREAQ